MSRENLKDLKDTDSVDDNVTIPEVTFENTKLGGAVGIDSITNQIQAKFMKRGFDFNIIVVGQTGLGKSTFVNTLFTTHLVDSKGSKSSSDIPRKTVEISTRSHILNENGVKLRISITDTPGFGEQLNGERCWEPVVDYIFNQHNNYYVQDSAVSRKKFIRDNRVHVCLYFIGPSQTLKPIDIESMKEISTKVNLVPVIAKSDTLTLDERAALKKRINEEIKFHGIKVYPSDYSDYDAEEMAANKIVTNLIPFAVIGSEKTVVVDGKSFPGRRLGWGMINVEDPAHCEFSQLKNFLIKTHMQDLIDVTSHTHYEEFRSMRIEDRKDRKEKKEKKEKKK